VILGIAMDPLFPNVIAQTLGYPLR